jgi:hypothetical protein
MSYIIINKKGVAYNAYQCIFNTKGVFKNKRATSFASIEKAKEKIEYILKCIRDEEKDQKKYLETFTDLKYQKECLDDLNKYVKRWLQIFTSEVKIIEYN